MTGDQDILVHRTAELVERTPSAIQCVGTTSDGWFGILLCCLRGAFGEARR